MSLSLYSVSSYTSAMTSNGPKIQKMGVHGAVGSKNGQRPRDGKLSFVKPTVPHHLK
jgi:hypothetical protein